MCGGSTHLFGAVPRGITTVLILQFRFAPLLSAEHATAIRSATSAGHLVIIIVRDGPSVGPFFLWSDIPQAAYPVIRNNFILPIRTIIWEVNLCLARIT
jgi:hypothetical protein